MKWPPPRFTTEDWADLVGWLVFGWIAIGVTVISFMMVVAEMAIYATGMP